MKRLNKSLSAALMLGALSGGVLNVRAAEIAKGAVSPSLRSYKEYRSAPGGLLPHVQGGRKIELLVKPQNPRITAPQEIDTPMLRKQSGRKIELLVKPRPQSVDLVPLRNAQPGGVQGTKKIELLVKPRNPAGKSRQKIKQPANRHGPVLERRLPGVLPQGEKGVDLPMLKSTGVNRLESIMH